MKQLLEQSVKALIAGNIQEARNLFGKYAKLKSAAILEDGQKQNDSDILHGHCDACGEDSSMSHNMKAKGKWTCGNCGGKKFVHEPNKKLKESEEIKKGAFHKWLGKSEDADITQEDIDKGLNSKNKHVRKMAQFAKNMQHIKK